jgi:hypothetical protein
MSSCRCSSFIDLSLGSLTWFTYAYGMRCQDDVASWRVFTHHPMCMPILLDLALQLMYDYDQLLMVILSSGTVAMLGMGAGPSKLW